MSRERVQSEGVESKSVAVAMDPEEAPPASVERPRRRTRAVGSPPATAKRQRRPLGARGEGGRSAAESAEEQAKIELSNALITKYASLVRQIAGGFQRK